MNLQQYTREFSYNLKLAYPIILGMIGHTLVGIVDNIMVGKLGPTELAAVSLGNSFIFIAMSFGIGFSTAITRGVEFIHALRTSTGSHERIAVVELFGRYSGQTSLVTAYLAGVDRAVISEVPFDVERLASLLLADKAANPSNYAMVTISEGAIMTGGELHLSGEEDAYGHRKLGGIGAVTGQLIGQITGMGIVLQQVAYLMRSGTPDSLDLMVATNFAVMAADLVLEGASGRMVALRGGTYTNVPISVTREGVKRVDVDEMYDTRAYRPKVRHMAGKPMFLY